ncbi:flagellar hook-length control protein FliK [Devosia sp.]|uniref:flagellar hook-length control protein FliK n=1 Tax=Devosia sp. TaxID=1871048 RepID=UPI00292D9E8E|nr:flagellar hook-length control protein FliK [Devosia sp.]
MASHLTVTTTTAGVSTSKSLNTSGEPAEGAVDVFSALLGAATPQANPETAKTSASSMDINLGNLVNMSLGFGEGEAGENEDPEAVAAVIDAVVPIQDTTEAVPVLADIVSTLADLKAKLDAGEPLDPEALRQLEAALTELAAALDIELDALPSLDDLTALLTQVQPADTSLAARLTAAFGPVAETLFSGSAAENADADAELSALMKSVGDKLAALLTALNNGELDAEQLARLELGAEADADIEAALARLAKSVPTLNTSTAAPALATPELKLTEPTLTGKTTVPAETAAPVTETPEKTTETAEAAPPVQASADGDDRDREAGEQDRKPADPRSPVATAAIDKQPEPQNTGLPQQASARAEMVAAPRVVQAGYQTSQQQLNLPQLAFELVRQVNEGNSRFQIRLDPPELGRIDVRLDIDKSGQVNARLIVEKSETLDLMQRDQRALERALQQAGLDGAKTNLEFSLKQNPFGAGQQGNDRGNGRNPIFGDEVAADADATPPPTVNLYRGSLTASGVNIIA